jgi:transketolase
MEKSAELHIRELKKIAAEVRIHIVKTVHHAGAGHIGGPLSAADLLTALYFRVMNVRPEQPDFEDRDRFVLSKGHSAIALYSVLAERGYFPREELATFDKIDSRLQAHPDMKLLPGLDMSSGSLGQGISAAVGMALAAKLKKAAWRVYCMIGDGESQEGQVWEAADIAAKYGLDNLTVILDWNRLQQYGWPGADGRERRAPVERPVERWRAFGFHAVEIDGHDFTEILRAFDEAKAVRGRPQIIVARTVKGKGVGFMENAHHWHSRVPTAEELAQAIEDIRGGLAS